MLRKFNMKSFYELMDQIELTPLSQEEMGISARPEYELDYGIHDMDIDLNDNGLKKLDDLFISLREDPTEEAPF